MAVVTRFQDSEYVNWIKVGQALLCTVESICDFCEKPINQYHIALRQKFPRQPCKGICQLSGLCTVCANRRREWKKDICSQFTPRTNPCWMNADGSKWETDAWEIAKVFMGPGQHASRSNAAATDPIGLLQLVLNCQLFNSCILDRQPFEDVRDIRNDMFHSANFKLTNTEMTDHIKAMTTLLEDPTLLKNDGKAKVAVQQLQKIEALPLETNNSQVLQAERDMWEQKIEHISKAQSFTKEEVEKFTNFVTEQKDLNSYFGKEIISLKSRVDILEAVQQQVGQDLSEQQVCHQQLQERQKKHGEDISQLQQATQATHQTVRAVQQQVGQDLSEQQVCHQQLQERQKKHGEDISQLQQSTQATHQTVRAVQQHVQEYQRQLQKQQSEQSEDIPVQLRKQIIQWKSAKKPLDEFIQLVVKNERTKEASVEDEDKTKAHKTSALLLLMIIYECQQPELWRHVSEYVLEGGKELNLENRHLGPLPLDALAYVLPKTDITSLNLDYCGLMEAAENVLVSIGHLSQLLQLRLFGNYDLHGTGVTTNLSDSLPKLTKLEELSMGRCQLNDEDVSRLSSALTELTCLIILGLQQNCISDVGALNVARVAVTLPCLKELWLCSNWLTDKGMEGVREVARHTPRLWLVGLDMQRLPGHEAIHPDDVVFWERVVNQLQLAMSRVLERPGEMRDSRWDDDVAGLETWLEKTKEELDQARLRQSQQ